MIFPDGGIQVDRKKQFEVEALEPRILLSGEGMAAGLSLNSPLLSVANFTGNSAIEESISDTDFGTQSGIKISLSAASQIDDIFEGLSSSELTSVSDQKTESISAQEKTLADDQNPVAENERDSGENPTSKTVAETTVSVIENEPEILPENSSRNSSTFLPELTTETAVNLGSVSEAESASDSAADSVGEGDSFKRYVRAGKR